MSNNSAELFLGIPKLLPHYEELYRTLHLNAELSKHEETTASIVARELEEHLGVLPKTHIGGYGVVGTFSNGPGKTILLRAELDGLPVREATGLPYSCTKTMIDRRTGRETPVMHACGHDMHATSLLLAARVLIANKHHWSGTLVVLFQPSEEDGAGAQEMVDDGLYDPARHAVPRPNAVLAGHTMPNRAGQVRTRVGVINGAVHSVKATIHGRGGHGARPQNAVDPVVVGSSIVMKLQTVVSRAVAPTESVVVTVGSFHAGYAENVIGDQAELLINIRSLRTETLRIAVDTVERFIHGECTTFGCPKPPTLEYIGGFPLLNNDAQLSSDVIQSFRERFGERYEEEPYPSLGAEDLANLAVEGSECCFWNIGCIDPSVWDAAVADNSVHKIAGNHNPEFAPVIQPTLTTAAEALIVAALTAFR